MAFNASPAFAVKYAKISDSGNAAIFIDFDSIAVRAADGLEYVVGWSKTVFHKTRTSKRCKNLTYDTIYVLEACDPENPRVQYLTLRFYLHGKEVKSCHSDFVKGRYKEVLPDTVAYSVYEVLTNTAEMK